MIALTVPPVVHTVASIATTTIAGAVLAVTTHDTTLSLALVLVGATIPSAVAIFLSNRAIRSQSSVALVFATEAAARVDAVRVESARAAAAVLNDASAKAELVLATALAKAEAVLAAAVPKAEAVVATAAVVAEGAVAAAVPVAEAVVAKAADRADPSTP